MCLYISPSLASAESERVLLRQQLLTLTTRLETQQDDYKQELQTLNEKVCYIIYVVSTMQKRTICLNRLFDNSCYLLLL